MLENQNDDGQRTNVQCISKKKKVKTMQGNCAENAIFSDAVHETLDTYWVGQFFFSKVCV